jgi:rhodanese-related sulfurtransferase
MTSEHRVFKNALYDQFARIGRAMANPHRLELLDLLAQGERRVEELAREANLPIANASQHLQVLRRARLVEIRRQGTSVYYRLGDERVFRLWQALRDLGQTRLAEVDALVRTYLEDRDQFEAVDVPALQRLLHEEDVVVLDVRPATEYRAGHIPGAYSIPIDELTARLHELPAEREIVAYCRGPYCVFADEAVALLRARGYRASRLAEGFPDWRAAGFPVAFETSPRERNAS